MGNNKKKQQQKKKQQAKAAATTANPETSTIGSEYVSCRYLTVC